VAKTLGPRSPPRLREETDLHRLGEDLVRVVSETLLPEHVSSLPIASRSGASTRAATLPPPDHSWWYNCNIIYKMLEVLEAARLMLMG
jgi:hypothetical protein